MTVSGQASPPGAVKHPPPATRRDARRNHDRVLAAAGEVLGESGADAGMEEIAARARAAGTVNPGITAGDVLVLVWAMRGLVQAAGQAAPEAWPRFLDIQLAGLRASGPVSSTPPLSARQLAELAPAGRARRSRAAGKPIVDLALG